MNIIVIVNRDYSKHLLSIIFFFYVIKLYIIPKIIKQCKLIIIQKYYLYSFVIEYFTTSVKSYC